MRFLAQRSIAPVGGGLSVAGSGLAAKPAGIPYSAHVLSDAVRAKYKKTEYSKNVKAPSTVAVYQTVAQKIDIVPHVVPLEAGGLLCWLGSTTAKRVWYYIVGGGYTWPAIDGHFLFLNSVQKAMEALGHDFAVCVLSYDLAPTAKHPTQLKQAVSGLQYLLQTVKVQPENVILGGDSAGANLTLMLLSHLVRPLPDTPSIQLGRSVFHSTILISPWVSFEYKGPTVDANKDICFVSAEWLDKAVEVWLDGQKQDEYTTPTKADPQWWRTVPSGDILVLGAEYEFFIDDIKAFVEKLEVTKKTELFVGTDEYHDAPIVYHSLGLPLTRSDRKLRGWLSARL